MNTHCCCALFFRTHSLIAITSYPAPKSAGHQHWVSTSLGRHADAAAARILSYRSMTRADKQALQVLAALVQRFSFTILTKPRDSQTDTAPKTTQLSTWGVTSHS